MRRGISSLPIILYHYFARRRNCLHLAFISLLVIGNEISIRVLMCTDGLQEIRYCYIGIIFHFGSHINVQFVVLKVKSFLGPTLCVVYLQITK